MAPNSVWLQHCLPQRWLARLVYCTSHSTRGWIRRPLIRWFSHHYAVNLDEAEHSDLDAFASFNAFFTRALSKDARPIAGPAQAIVSPVDGQLTEFGELQSGTLLQAKRLTYTFNELVGPGPIGSEQFAHGHYATLYLAPSDYHRVHMPVDGTLTAVRYIPGRRYSVNGATTRGIRKLFCRNERVVCWFNTERRSMILVLVGALNVSSISLDPLGEIKSGQARYWDKLPPTTYKKGQEIGRFNLGSTVIALFPQNAATWHSELASGQLIRLGQALGNQRTSDY